MQTVLFLMMIWVSASIILGFSIAFYMGRLKAAQKTAALLSKNPTYFGVESQFETMGFAPRRRVSAPSSRVLTAEHLGQLRQAGL